MTMDQGYADPEEQMSTAGQFEDMSAGADLGGQVKLESGEERRKRGGWVTAPFISGCDASERLAFQGVRANLITFLTKKMHFTDTGGTTVILNFDAGALLMSLLGAFVADSYLGRFKTIAFSTCISLLGMAILTLIPLDKSTLLPVPCTIQKANAGQCERASSLQLGLLYLAFSLMALGAGGIRPCVLPFGASQFDQAHPQERKELKHYFNWYWVAVTMAPLLATTVVVYVQDNVGWALGFGIPAIILLVSIFFFFGGISLYRFANPRGSPFTRMAQVVVATFFKRNLALPDDPSKLYHGGATKYERRANGADCTDEKEGLKKPSSDDEKGDGSFAIREHGHHDLNHASYTIQSGAVIEGRGQAAVADVITAPPDAKFVAEAKHEGNLEFEKNDTKASGADLFHVEKAFNEFPGKETDEILKTWEVPAASPHRRTEDDEDSVIVLRHSDQFRFLDKAAIAVARDWPNFMGKEGQIQKETNPWTLCTVHQVEELKCILRLIPMWATVVPTAMSASLGQTYVILAAQTMDRRLGKFVVPAASLSTISTITVLIWLPFYDKIVTPFLRKFTGKKGITFLQRIGIGFVFLILAELVRMLVEHKRRDTAARYGLVKRHDALPMSALWLIPQFVILGLSESFMMVGHMEFFYFMLPEYMTSTGSALLNITLAVGTSLSVVVLNIAKKLGWLDDNINTDHLDNVYGLVTVCIALDFVIFLVVARWYKRQSHLNEMMLRLS